MERPVLISWDCYGCFEPVYSWLGRAAPCRNCEPTVFEDDDNFYAREDSYGYWVNGTGIEVTSRSDQIEQDAVWEEYDFRMELLDQDWEEAMEQEILGDLLEDRAPWPRLSGRWHFHTLTLGQLGQHTHGGRGPWIPGPADHKHHLFLGVEHMCDLFGVPKELIFRA